MRPLFYKPRRYRLTEAGVVWVGYFSLVGAFIAIGVLLAWRG